MKKKLTALFISVLLGVFLLCGASLPVSAATSIAKATVTYTSDYTYTGKAIKPKVTVKLKGKTLSTKYYTVAYKNNKNVGTATITVTGKSGYSGKITKYFYINPKKVTSLKGSIASSKISLSWTKVTGATAYQVYRYNSSKKAWEKIGTTTSTKYTASSLKPLTTYKFKVRAYNKKGNKTLYGAYSDTYTATTIPASPASLKATATTSSLKVSWKAVSKAAGYQISQYDNENKAWLKAVYVGNKTYRSFSSLDIGTRYSFRVRAYAKVGKKTYYSAYSYLYASTLPDKPASVKTSSVTDSSVKLTWSKVSGVSGYRIYVSEYNSNGKAGTYESYATVKGNKTFSKVIGSLEGNKTYRFAVKAYYSASKASTAYSSYSYSPVITTLPPEVQNFYCAEITNNTVILGWDENTSVGGYIISMDDGSGKKKIASVAKSKDSYTVEGLEELKDYDFYIKSYAKQDGKYVYGKESKITASTDDSTVKDLFFTATKSTLGLGASFKAKAEVYPSYAANQKVTYSSSNPDVISINAVTGEMKALSVGSAKINAKSDEGDFEISFSCKVKIIEASAITLPQQITLFLGNSDQAVSPAKVVPNFIPADTTDKSYAISAEPYTKKVLLSTYTRYFEDYVTFNSATGTFTAKKVTKGDTIGWSDDFSFDVTFTTSSGKTATTKIRVVKAPKLTLGGNGLTTEWKQGAQGQFTATLESNKYITKNDLSWTSSNPDVATVDDNGNVICKAIQGSSEISFSDPYGSLKASFIVSAKIAIKNIKQSYYDNCKVGDVYRLEFETDPVTPRDSIIYQTTDSSVATVSEEGIVTIIGEGSANIILRVPNQLDIFQIIFTSKSFALPEGTDSELFYLFREKANSIKSANVLRGFRKVESAASSNVKTTVLSSGGTGESTFGFHDSFVKPLLDGQAQEKVTVTNSVNITDENYDEENLKYLNKVPVAGNTHTILPDLTPEDIKSIEIAEIEDSLYYKIKVSFKEEVIESLPLDHKAAQLTTHGQAFDIITKERLNSITKSYSVYNEEEKTQTDFNIGFENYKTTYHDSSVTVYINKITDEVSSLEYDMNIDSVVTNLDFSLSVQKNNVEIISAQRKANVSFSTNHKVKIDFFG